MLGGVMPSRTGDGLVQRTWCPAFQISFFRSNFVTNNPSENPPPPTHEVIAKSVFGGKSSRFCLSGACRVGQKHGRKSSDSPDRARRVESPQRSAGDHAAI